MAMLAGTPVNAAGLYSPGPATAGALAAPTGVVINPGSAAFGDVKVGTRSSTLSFTATNYTSSAIGYISVSGSSAFSLQPGTCHLASGEVMLGVGASCTFTASFLPAALGSATATLNISTSSGPFTFQLTGLGVPAISVLITPSSGVFGNVAVGTASPTLSFTAVNDTDSTIGNISVSGSSEFHLSAGTCHFASNEVMLAEGASCVFHAYFAPTKVGAATATLGISTSSGPFTFTLTGAGVSVAPVLPVSIPGGPYTGVTGQTITFSGSGSTAPSGQTVTAYTWNFGDGSSGTTATPAHSYTSQGTYSVTLTVKDTAGQSASATTTATITAAPPALPVSNPGGPYTGTTGQAVSFSGSGSTAPSGQTIAAYTWNFGDGSTGTSATPTHIYTAPGTYNVTLTVKDSGGQSVSATATASITNAAPVLLTSNPGGPYTGLTDTPIDFSGSGSTAPTGQTLSTYTWNFGDGTSAVVVTPAHIYSSPGTYNVSLTVKDTNGQTAVSTTTAKVTTATNPLTITAVVSPAPNSAGWNKSPVTVSFTCSSTGSSAVQCPASQTLSADGAGQIVTGTVTDTAGDTNAASVTVNLEVTPPSLTVTSPTAHSTVTLSTSSIGISGTVSSTVASIVSVTCKGTPATVSGRAFTCTSGLTAGSNPLPIVATDIAGNVTTVSLNLTYIAAPALRIIAPANLGVTNLTPVTVNGTVSDTHATITLDGVAVAQSGGAFSTPVPLVEGLNLLTAVATNAAGVSTTATIQITLDTTPPHVQINSPANGSVLTASSVSVTGLANDVVVGTVNLQDLGVTVNGVAAQVANRSFSALNVPLALGANTIQATGTDRAGNSANTTVTVTRVLPSQPPAAAVGATVLTQWVNIVSGNNQTAAVGKSLASPIVVSLTDSASHPLANKTIVFQVTANNGSVAATGQTPSSAAAITTDANGQARVTWTLGQRSGAGNNVLQVSSALAVSPATFTATGTTGPAAMVVVDSGNNQTGVIDQSLPFPFVVDLVDTGHNRVPNVPITFSVKRGGGSFAGAPTSVVTTDSNGRAIAVLTEGTTQGIDNNLVEATFSGNSFMPAAFIATAKAPGNASATTISGVVLDNSNRPIPGVTIRLYKTNQGSGNNLPVQVGTSMATDAAGSFVIAPAPVGSYKLMADGSTATTASSYPTLEYDIITVAGNDNTVGMPIYLPALDTVNKVCVDETHGGILTLPQYPGFALNIAAGSATFPGGSRTGCVSATPVNGDKVPMAPGFGQQPRFIVTIQPVGTMFSPPAAMSLPNVDGLPAKSVTEMYSYDHDLSMFVAIGTGTVSNDGSIIKSDPGVGVVKAGWHCGGNPDSTGSAATCPDCQTCQGDNCMIDRSLDGTTPASGMGCCFNGNVVPKVAPDYNTLTTMCPNRTENPDAALKPNSSDGCSSPLGNNPAGGADSAFGSVTTCTVGLPNCVLNPPHPLACEHHDFCYRTCKGASDPGKDTCDNNFYSEMNQICSNLPFLEGLLVGESCYNYAAIYYEAVSHLGNNAFNGDQIQACKCCP